MSGFGISEASEILLHELDGQPVKPVDLLRRPALAGCLSSEVRLALVALLYKGLVELTSDRFLRRKANPSSACQPA